MLSIVCDGMNSEAISNIDQSKYILIVKNLCKIYGEGSSNEVHALQGVNLTIKHGEMVAIMGPSGCGKTTLLNMIGGLDTPSKGSVTVNSKIISEFTEMEITQFRRDNIGYVFQLFNLFEYMSATENVMLPLLTKGWSNSPASQAANVILNEVGLGDRTQHYPTELSGGQQQRVAISRALINNPTIILGDEPTGDLDSVTSKNLIEILRRINIENKQTLILVTHSIWIAEQCDRIINLKDGRVTEGVQVREVDHHSASFQSTELNELETSLPQEELPYQHVEKMIIEGIDLYKSYHTPFTTVNALQGINLRVRKGEFIAIVGPSGQGKTTLINILTGLDLPDKGKVYLEGKDISLMNDDNLAEFRREKIGIVFQDYILDPHLTVWENVALPKMMIGGSNNFENKVNHILDKVGMLKHANKNPMQLSGGEMQRVVIARACINSPSVIFADEPTGDLDSETGVQIMKYFRELCDEDGIGIVLVTHDMQMASFADRVINLVDGIIQRGGD
ncbi:MAG: ABC transporter ATP-binding protein [Candidatus Kariarchaeaceae archaeon]